MPPATMSGRRVWSCSAIRRSARPSSPPIPKAGLDWPVRVLVYQAEDGAVYAAYTDFDWIAKRHGITNRDKEFKMATEVIESVTSTVRK